MIQFLVLKLFIVQVVRYSGFSLTHINTKSYRHTKKCELIWTKDRVCIQCLLTLTHSDVLSCPWMLMQGQHRRTGRSGCAWTGSSRLCIVVGTGRKALRSALGSSQMGYWAADIACPEKDRQGELRKQEGGWLESLPQKEVSREMAVVLNCRGDSWSRRVGEMDSRWGKIRKDTGQKVTSDLAGGQN